LGGKEEPSGFIGDVNAKCTLAEMMGVDEATEQTGARKIYHVRTRRGHTYSRLVTHRYDTTVPWPLQLY
jgi:hypothetical protein